MGVNHSSFVGTCQTRRFAPKCFRLRRKKGLRLYKWSQSGSGVLGTSMGCQGGCLKTFGWLIQRSFTRDGHWWAKLLKGFNTSRMERVTNVKPGVKMEHWSTPRSRIPGSGPSGQLDGSSTPVERGKLDALGTTRATLKRSCSRKTTTSTNQLIDDRIEWLSDSNHKTKV